ncbi:MAG: sodium transporter, partial [Saprospiraceae bacterium]|nr:sodium transporter [Saprospiraceae bacterium]
MEGFQLSVLDITIMVGYALLIIAYGLYHGKRQSSEDYFLAGRGMTWPIVGIALFSANISSSTLIGLAGDAYKTNMHVYNYEWFAVVVLIFFAIFFLPFYLRSGVYTMPEFLEKRYDRRSRYYFSFITIIGNVMVDTAAGLYVGSIVLKLLFPELPSWQIILLLAVAAAAYTIPGGLNSVIQTEVIQAILLVIGSCLLTYFAFKEFGGGWSDMMVALTERIQSGQVPSIEAAKEAGH